MTSTLKLAIIMKIAHAHAKRKREQFSTYKQALSAAMKAAWRVAKGKALVEDADVSKDYGSYTFDSLITYEGEIFCELTDVA